MVLALDNNYKRFGLFFTLAAAIISIAYWLVTAEQFNASLPTLSIGIAVDIALLIPILYFLIIRKSSIPKITIVPVFVLSLLTAYRIMPDQYEGTLNYIEMLLIPIELTVIGLLFYYVIKIGRGLDQTKSTLSSFPETLKMVLEKARLNGIQSNVISSEASLFYYTFAGWGKSDLLAENEFSYYKSSGYKSVFVVVLFLLPAETFALHYWLQTYSDTLAWVLTALSIYSLFFILGDRNSIRHRPIAVASEALKINIGIRWSFDLTYDLIENVELREGDETSEKFANLSTFGYGNVMITLKEKTQLRGIYGIRKKTDKIALSIDDKERFMEQLSAKLPDSLL